MSLFAITFRIDYDTDSGYPRRYDSLIKEVKRLAGGQYWDDPTSFFLIVSDLTSTKLADDLVSLSEFDESKDHILVINISATKGHAHRGKLIDHDLPKLMAFRS